MYMYICILVIQLLNYYFEEILFSYETDNRWMIKTMDYINGMWCFIVFASYLYNTSFCSSQ